MEYFLGCLITLATLAFASRINNKHAIQQRPLIRNTQSIKVEATKDFLKKIIEPKPIKKTQSRVYLSKTSTRVLILQNHAYWIANNALYTADIVDGEVDENSTRTVDTMGMDKVQLDKTIFIV
jgi:hypothetical protein